MNIDSFNQQELRLIGQVKRPERVAEAVIDGLPSFRAALRHAVNHSGLNQCEVAEACGIDPGEFSRMLRDPKREGARPREFPHDKLPLFCRITNSKAPAQWHAIQMGDELTPRRIESMEQQIQRLTAENARLRLVGMAA